MRATRRTGRAGRAAALAIAAGTLLACAALAPAPVRAETTGSGTLSARLERMLAGIPADRVPTRILLDRVLPPRDLYDLDGVSASRPITRAAWRQAYDGILRAARPALPWPALAELDRRAASSPRGIVPIALLDVAYDRLRPEALATGALLERDGRLFLGPEGDGAFDEARLFAAAPLRERTYQGERVLFRLDPGDIFRQPRPAPGLPAGSAGTALRFTLDFDDGRGPVALLPGEVHPVRYATSGTKTIRLRAGGPGGPELTAAFLFEVRALRTPAPDDTLEITAAIPYLGAYGSGRAYVYLSDQHATLTEPVVVIEGFDLDNSMSWDELYELLNREQLLETLRADGYDAVVLDFDDATDYLQRNSFVVTALIEEVRARIAPGKTIALAGASMGGLIGRYALAYMESNDLEHTVRTFVSFDSPQSGADIPLGIQYWLWFFADQSVDAAAWLAALDSPAARQLLLYHHTDPPGATGEPDPLRAQLEADIAAVGDYPALPRKVAVANGSGAQAGQGFSAGDQLIRWEYESFLVDITGNVWAVPDQTSATIFRGLIDFLFLPPEESIVTVSGTRPADNAPGGWRATMLDLDATDPGYGDIVALHPNHCFIPAVSALALETDDLFYDIAGDPEILAHTPFDAVYFPAANQEHVDINAENVGWLISEIEMGSGAAPEGTPPARPLARIAQPALQAGGDAVRIRYAVPASGEARLALYDLSGRRIALLAQGHHEPGAHEILWARSAAQGRRIERGICFLRLDGAGFSATARIALP